MKKHQLPAPSPQPRERPEGSALGVRQRASIALISLLVISAFTIILVIGMSESNISVSKQFLNNEINKLDYYGAEACLEEAMIRLERDPNFTTATLSVTSEVNCTVTAAGSNPTTLSITVTTLKTTQNFQAQINITASGQANNIQLLSWKEV